MRIINLCQGFSIDFIYASIESVVAEIREENQKFERIALAFKGFLPIRIILITGCQSPVQDDQGYRQSRPDEIKQQVEFRVR